MDSRDSVFSSNMWFLRVLLFASEKTTREGGGYNDAFIFKNHIPSDDSGEFTSCLLF